MNRIQKVSSYLLIVFNILLITLPLLAITQWVFIAGKTSDVSSFINFFGMLERTIQTPEGIVNLSTVHWTPLTKFIGFMGSLLSNLPILLGLVILKSLFHNYKNGEIFNTYNACQYKYLGWLFFLDAFIIRPLSEMLQVLAVTLTFPSGHRYITLSFGTPNIEALFCGVLVIVIFWIMVEGYKLQEEQKFTV